MQYAIEKKSRILALKSKFFLYRALIYFSFLLLPVWVQKIEGLPNLSLVGLMFLYILFMGSQWFHLGKEVDHRLKIYYRVNSSIDRVIYRLILGMLIVLIYFNFLSFFPIKWANNLFWATWVVSGIFYSWPTRGKIIRESVSSNFNEFRYLDSFEKTLVGLIVLMFFFSLPEISELTEPEALKLYFDPHEYLNSQIWNFIKINYIPFHKYPFLTKLAWGMHFYVVQLGLFLMVFYAFLRFFISRRLSLLGVFALLSSWSFSKLLVHNLGISFFSTYSLIWIWTLLWVTKSSTYRSGLFMGLIGLLGTIIYQPFVLLYIAQLLIMYFLTLKHKTFWFRRQVVKYNSLGIIFIFLTLLLGGGWSGVSEFWKLNVLQDISTLVGRKAFYSLSFIGLILIFAKIYKVKILEPFKIKTEKLKILLISILLFLVFSIPYKSFLIEGFSLMWFITFCSLIPLEILFQATSRLRSRRNMLYLIYILICLLDSHFEGRVKIFLRFLAF